MSTTDDDVRPTDVHPQVEHPPADEDRRQLQERRHRCSWMIRQGMADDALDLVEMAAQGDPRLVQLLGEVLAAWLRGAELGDKLQLELVELADDRQLPLV